MRHDWVLDVLRDLKSYAARNDLPLLGAAVEQTLSVAQAEIEAVQGAAPTLTGHAAQGRGRRPH
jgi:hypothetical protein